jgi:ADP-heptose:LPS heptosyltransferase
MLDNTGFNIDSDLNLINSLTPPPLPSKILDFYSKEFPLISQQIVTGSAVTTDKSIIFDLSSIEGSKLGDVTIKVPTLHRLSQKFPNALFLTDRFPIVSRAEIPAGSLVSFPYHNSNYIESAISALTEFLPDVLILCYDTRAIRELASWEKALLFLKDEKGLKLPQIIVNFQDVSVLREPLPLQKSSPFTNRLLSSFALQSLSINNSEPLNSNSIVPKLFVKQEEIVKAKNYLKNNGFNPAKDKLLLIGDRGSYSGKEWPLIGDFVKYVLENHVNWKIAFIDPLTEFDCGSFALNDSQGIVFSAKREGRARSLELIPGFMWLADKFFGIDSGPGHLFSAIQASKNKFGGIITIFNGHNPQRWKPCGQNLLIFNRGNGEFGTFADYDWQEFEQNISPIGENVSNHFRADQDFALENLSTDFVIAYIKRNNFLE